MLSPISPSELVKNIYIHMNRRREKDLCLRDPLSQRDVPQEEYFYKHEANAFISISKNFLPLGVSSTYRLFDNPRHGPECAHLSFALYIDMKSLDTLVEGEYFSGITFQKMHAGKRVYEKEGKPILEISRGPEGYRHCIFLPEGESQGIGVRKVNNYAPVREACTIIDRIYEQELFCIHIPKTENTAGMDVTLQNFLSANMSLQMELLTRLEIHREAKESRKRVVRSAIEKASSKEIAFLLRYLKK